MMKALSVGPQFKLSRTPDSDPNLRGGTTKRALTPEEVQWAKERAALVHSQRALQRTIKAIRAKKAAQADLDKHLAFLRSF